MYFNKISIFLNTIFLVSQLSSVYASEQVQCGNLDSEYKVEALTGDTLEADSSLWKIYENSFPANERTENKSLIRDVKTSPRRVALRLVERSTTIGLAFLKLLDDIPVSLLEYLAIEESKRSKNLGSKFCECALTESKRRALKKGLRLTAMIVEVERPDLAQSEQDEVMRKRRISFYNLLGGWVISKTYFMPPLRSGEDKIDMYLMAIPAAGVDRILTESFVLETTRAIYREIYTRYWEAEGSSFWQSRYLFQYRSTPKNFVGSAPRETFDDQSEEIW